MQKVYSEYREGVMKIDHTYLTLFRTAFYKDLKFQMDAKINESLGLEVVKPARSYETPSKMKLIFEDGVLISYLLGYGWIPFSAKLGYELRQQGSSFFVSLIYNWQTLAFPSPGPCAGQSKCPYEQFTQWVATQAYLGEDYANVY